MLYMDPIIEKNHDDIEAALEAEERFRVEEIIDGHIKLMTQADLARRLDEVRAKHTA